MDSVISFGAEILVCIYRTAAFQAEVVLKTARTRTI